jgi:hypothetical protein
VTRSLGRSTIRTASSAPQSNRQTRRASRPAVHHPESAPLYQWRLLPHRALGDRFLCANNHKCVDSGRACLLQTYVSIAKKAPHPSPHWNQRSNSCFAYAQIHRLGSSGCQTAQSNAEMDAPPSRDPPWLNRSTARPGPRQRLACEVPQGPGPRHGLQGATGVRTDPQNCRSGHRRTDPSQV